MYLSPFGILHGEAERVSIEARSTTIESKALSRERSSRPLLQSMMTALGSKVFEYLNLMKSANESCTIIRSTSFQSDIRVYKDMCGALFESRMVPSNGEAIGETGL